MDEEEEVYSGPSKTSRKKAMIALQLLGEELVELSSDQLAQVPLPEELRDAVRDAKRIRAFGALRRQMQYIGRLMRDIDPDPVSAALDRIRQRSGAAVAELHELERWRDRLLASDAALAELMGRYPACDRQHLASLVRAARREQAEARAPRSFRALFQELKALFAPPDAQGGAAQGPDEDEDEDPGDDTQQGKPLYSKH